MSDIELLVATNERLPLLLPLVRAYHEFEGISLDEESRKSAVLPLLEESDLGRIWLIRFQDEFVGYIAICFGYSIEFGGRDAFLDEFFISEHHRGCGLGQSALALVCTSAAELGVRALHLEVARTNTRAQRLYAKTGFVARERYFLMSRCTKNSES